MQNIVVDKTKTPEVRDWSVDKEPGDKVCLYGTIKANDDQSLTITVEEVGDHHEEDEDEEDKPMGGNEGSDAAPPDGGPGGTMPGLGDGMDAP